MMGDEQTQAEKDAAIIAETAEAVQSVAERDLRTALDGWRDATDKAIANVHYEWDAGEATECPDCAEYAARPHPRRLKQWLAWRATNRLESGE